MQRPVPTVRAFMQSENLADDYFPMPAQHAVDVINKANGTPRNRLWNYIKRDIYRSLMLIHDATYSFPFQTGQFTPVH